MASVSPRVAIVTGAASGIGRAIALQLAADGTDVAVNDLPGTEVVEVVKQIEALGRRSFAAYGDVSDDAQVAKMVEESTRALGSLDIMVANAGISKLGGILDATVEDFDQVMAVNARGVFLCYKHAATYMVNQGRGGRLIGASSAVGRQGAPGMIAYSATKFAIRGMTQSAARDLAVHNITVNAFAPGFTDTPMTRNGFGDDMDAIFARLKIPIGRLATPEDVAHIVSYIASDKSSYVTGQTFSVNGGMSFD